jgi:hypothetical protein
MARSDHRATVASMEAARAATDWICDGGVDLEERIATVKSLPERLAMFELGKVLVPVVDAAVPLGLKVTAVEALSTKADVNVLVRLPSRPAAEVRRAVSVLSTRSPSDHDPTQVCGTTS